MTLTWEELSVETHLRSVVTSEVDDIVFSLETMNKRDITVTAYQFAYSQVEGLMADLKVIHADFRKKAAANGLLQNEHFVEDARAIVKWQIDIWNKLDKLKPKNMINPASGQAASVNQQGNVLHDALYNLDLTLQKHNDEHYTNIKLNRPHFKGGKEKETFLDFDRFQKDFLSFTRNIKDKMRLLQLLRDTTSGSARNQIEEFDLIADNYDKAWLRLEKVYKKPDECKALLIDKIFAFQFNMSIDRLDEYFNNYCLLIEKLKSSYNINLLDELAGTDTVLAHLTFKKLPQSLKNVLLELCSTHYPTFSELKKFIPKAIERIQRSKPEVSDSLSCANVIKNDEY